MKKYTRKFSGKLRLHYRHENINQSFIFSIIGREEAITLETVSAISVYYPGELIKTGTGLDARFYDVMFDQDIHGLP